MLYEADLPRYALPRELERIYGAIGFGSPVLFSNFVTSLDGVVALGATPSAGSVISGRNPADRFLMGLLRACADAVIVGAGTLRATPGHRWTAGHIFPQLEEPFRELRVSLGRRAEPRLVVLTSTGAIDPSHPAIAAGATFVTPAKNANELRRQLPQASDVIARSLETAIEELHSRGLNVLLTEGGPHVMGDLLDRALLDEMFITISPVTAGRGSERRLGMVEGIELLPGRGVWTRILSARRNGDYLFLRYGIKR